MIELRVFGGVALCRDGVPIGGRAAQRHQLALLALLAVSPSGAASRDKLIGYLWPERDTRKARHRLSVALHVLRRELGEAALVTSGDGVALSPDAVWTDAGEFVTAVAEGRLGEAVELYRGSFLDGFFLAGAPDFDHWVESERAHLENLYRVALQRLIAEAEAVGDHKVAARWWELLSTRDPFSASTTRGHMRALAAVGDFGAAIRHARAYAALVEAELEIPPDPGVLELAEEIAQMAYGRPSTQPPKSPSESPTMSAESQPATAARRWSVGSMRGVLLSAGGLTVAAMGGALLLDRGGAVSETAVRPAVVVADFATSAEAPPAAGRALAERVATTLEIVPQLRSRTWLAEGSGPAPGVPPEGASVVRGAVEITGERAQARVALVEPRSGQSIWTGEYEAEVGTLDGLLEELSLDIALELRGALVEYVPKEYTPSRRAYDRFLQGVYAMRRGTREDMWQALQFHREAWEEDPDFALAHAIAGNAYFQLVGRGVSPEAGFELAREHVDESLALDSTLAEGHAALGYIQVWGDGDFVGGEASLRRAIMLYPTLPQSHTWYGFYLLYVRDRPAAAVRYVKRALEVDPLNTGRSSDVESVLYRTRRYTEVVDQSRITWSLDMDVAQNISNTALGHAYREMGRYEDALRTFQELYDRTGAGRAGMAMTYGRMGRPEEALALARALEGEGAAALPLARVYANVGDANRAFELLTQAKAERPDVMLQIVADPALDPIRDDPRFGELLAQLGVPR